MGGRKHKGESFPVEPIFPEAEPYPAIRALPKPIRLPNYHRPSTLTGMIKVQIDNYVRDAMRATGTEQPTPLPRSRAPRASDTPPLGGAVANEQRAPVERAPTPVEYDLEDAKTDVFASGGTKP